MSIRQVLVDADVLVYQAAFGAQKTRYRWKGKTFEDHKSMKDEIARQELDFKEQEWESFVEYLDESVVNIIAERRIKDIITRCKCDNLRYFLTGPGNYREEIATIKPYKGNRVADKPVHYDYAKQLFLDKYAAELHQGQEADDAMGIAQATAIQSGQDDTIIATIDKDLNIVPGWHFDWNKDLLYRVGRHDGLRYFHMQMLAGDATDNIPGIKRMGMKTAAKRFTDIKDNLGAQRKLIVEEYRKQYNYDWVSAINEVAKLLWIRQEAGQMIDFIAGDYAL